MPISTQRKFSLLLRYISTDINNISAISFVAYTVSSSPLIAMPRLLLFVSPAPLFIPFTHSSHRCHILSSPYMSKRKPRPTPPPSSSSPTPPSTSNLLDDAARFRRKSSSVPTTSSPLSSLKSVVDAFLLFDFFLILALLVFLGISLVPHYSAHNDVLLDQWLALWQPVIQPLLGILMLATIVQGSISYVQRRD